MRKQIPPRINDEQMLEDIISAKRGKRKDRLNIIKPQIRVAYNHYIANGASLGTMIPVGLNNTYKADMEHCYDASTRSLSILKEAVKMELAVVDKELCPYCFFREPGEFDHYLPKSKFQEFSVFSKNLIWSCHQCNHKKREHFSNADRYLNTYYDAIPDEPFLMCRINMPVEENGIDFFLQKPDTITDQQYKDIEDHVRKLGLIDTYAQRASQIVPVWLNKWKNLCHYYDKDSLKRHIAIDLQAEMDAELTKYGNNYFNVVLKRAVLERVSEIVSYLNS